MKTRKMELRELEVLTFQIVENSLVKQFLLRFFCFMQTTFLSFTELFDAMDVGCVPFHLENCLHCIYLPAKQHCEKRDLLAHFLRFFPYEINIAEKKFVERDWMTFLSVVLHVSNEQNSSVFFRHFNSPQTYHVAVSLFRLGCRS